MSDKPNLGPQTLEEAQANVREMIAKLDAEIQGETERFMEQRARILAYRPETFNDQVGQSHQLRELTWSFEERLHPVRRQREAMVGAIVRAFEAQPLKFYIELQPAQLDATLSQKGE